MSLFSRFASGRPGGHLHTSGIVGDSSKIGAASAESFQQRQQINQSRQFVAAYQDAGVLHNYRKNAHEPLQDHTENGGRHHKKRRSEIIPRTSRVDNRQTSRIENPRTSRVDSTARSQAAASQRPRISFNEPSSRRYNPYG